MININYVKRKNGELFGEFATSKHLKIDNCQNYSPIYDNFFSLNSSNFDSINLNNQWYIQNIKNEMQCTVKNIATNKTKDRKVFYKLAPLLDPFKYVLGKYDKQCEKLCALPSFASGPDSVIKKILSPNNSSYTDGFFTYLTSLLHTNYNFIHGVEFYGSFLGIKNDFKINIMDDLDYLCRSDFFNKNKNILFTVDNYDYLFNSPKSRPPIHISNMSAKSCISIENLDDIVAIEEQQNSVDELLLQKTSPTASHANSSACSSRTSLTTAEEGEGEGIGEEEGDEDSSTVWEDESGGGDGISVLSDEIFMTIPKFPVNVICMEKCEDTLDSYINENENISDEEWFAILMQVIMILLTYQKVFDFTHNDLHTNNIMYINTKLDYLYYCFEGTYYKVPTYGKIFKLIDFGRAIYKYKSVTCCSDCFKKNEDAHSQYNCEPFFNENKPRIEPNYSFDLCRLACSIFDYVVDDMSEIKNLNKCSPFVKLIVEWCLDDNNLNVLYKNTGEERYPDFKLYKMIARCVHRHTPKNQLLRPEFKAFITLEKCSALNIDLII